MARPRKPPAFLVEATVHGSAKLAGLPSDTARLGFFYAVLGQAKLATPAGQFASRAHFREVAGRFGAFLDKYIAAGILEVAPRLCERCLARWNPLPKPGALVVHDWHEHQYDPRALERGRQWDADHRGVSGGVSDRVSDRVSDSQSDAISDPLSDGFLARDRTAAPAVNVERRTTNGISSREDRSSLVPGRPDVAALLARGWPQVTKKQLGILDEIADRHDRPSQGEALGTWSAAIIGATPADWDPIGNLKATDATWQQERRAALDASEAAYAAEKAARDAQPAVDWFAPSEAGS